MTMKQDATLRFDHDDALHLGLYPGPLTDLLRQDDDLRLNMRLDPYGELRVDVGHRGGRLVWPTADPDGYVVVATRYPMVRGRLRVAEAEVEIHLVDGIWTVRLPTILPLASLSGDVYRELGDLIQELGE